jgi:cytoskeletal protein CcmA (bactofilin family)
LWNKQRAEDQTGFRPQPPAEPARTSQPVISTPPPRLEPHLARPTATIGSSMQIKGDIRTHEELMVDGEVEGSLESHSLLTVGPNGKVKANIKAREVVIFGSVRGNVEVSEKIAIREKGSLVGDIKTAGISIDDGAYFKGSIDIVRPEPKVATKPVKTEAPAEARVG